MSEANVLTPSPGRLDPVATALAYVINPLVLPPLLFGLVVAHFGAGPAELLWVVGVGLVFFGFIPLGYVLYLVRHGYVATLEVRDRTRRLRPFLVGLGACLGAVALFALTVETATSLVTALAACSAINTLVLLLITLRWKISVHAAAVAGFLSALLFVTHAPWADAGNVLSAVPAWAWAPLVVLTMWARVRTRAHTVGQVVGGAALGLVLPYAELYALLHLGAFASLT